MADNENIEKSAKNEKKPQETDTFLSTVYDIIGTLLKALAVILIIFIFFFRQVNVSGNSMNDTLQNQDRLIVWSFNYTPQNGDIVIVSHGAVLSEPIVKRVIATEGQKLRINYETGEVIVDGVLLNERYIKGKTIEISNAADIPEVIPEGYVFVMGDNREHSTDSRSRFVDIVPVNNVIGKAFLRIYPFESIGMI